MENWGLVVYKDKMLFFSSKIKPEQHLVEDISNTIAHETAHQWVLIESIIKKKKPKAWLNLLKFIIFKVWKSSDN